MMEKKEEEGGGHQDGRKDELGGVTNVAYQGSSADDDHVSSTGPRSAPPSSQDQLVKKRRADQIYGCGSFKPRCLGWLGDIRAYVFLAVLLCLTEGYAVNGIANTALLHLEKQFGLRSTQSALISSSQDIGALVVVLFVGYWGSRATAVKPHWVAAGSLVMALGSFLFIVPHLTTSAGQDSGSPPPTGICELTGGADDTNSTSPSSSSTTTTAPSNDLVHYLGLFMVANIIHGIGFCPMFTLGTVYIDENVDHSLSAVFVGMTYGATALGVALGFFTGGQISQKYYVDFDRIDQSKLTFGPKDPQWIGAWWVGFIPSCIVFVLLFLPIYGFPKSLPSQPIAEKNVDTAAKGKITEERQKSVCKEIFLPFLVAVKKLLANLPFVLLCLSAAAETLIISGVSSFAFKILNEQYSIDFDEAGNLLGGLIILGAAGMLSGGVLIRVLKLGAPGMCAMNGCLDLVAVALGVAILLASCPEVRLAGLEVPYPGDVTTSNYTSGCQGRCDCADVSFAPVCGKDERVYFSPCHAGCLSEKDPGPMATYHNCSCVAHALNVSSMSENAMANGGRCMVSCDNRNIFLPCLYLMFLAVLLTTTPNSMALLRIVHQDLRPFALGFQWMVIRLLGTIPGPPLVGYILDKACLVWTSGPDGSTFCALYAKADMALGFFIWWTVVNVLASALHFLAAFILRARNSKSVDLRSA